MTYDGMEAANGAGAGLAWESLVRGTADRAERDRIEKALLAIPEDRARKGAITCCDECKRQYANYRRRVRAQVKCRLCW
jgi:hypothetical protein